MSGNSATEQPDETPWASEHLWDVACCDDGCVICVLTDVLVDEALEAQRRYDEQRNDIPWQLP